MDEDWQKLERFYDGDESAFCEIFDQYKLKVFRLAQRVVHNRQTAEDIAQEVLLKIYQKKLKIKPSYKFFTWLYRVTLNASLDHIRTRKFLRFFSFSEDFDAPTTPAPAQEIENREIHLKLHEAIEALPERLKLPLVLYQFEGLDYAQVAQILEITSKAVERRLAAARQKLRKRLKNEQIF